MSAAALPLAPPAPSICIIYYVYTFNACSKAARMPRPLLGAFTYGAEGTTKVQILTPEALQSTNTDT